MLYMNCKQEINDTGGFSPANHTKLSRLFDHNAETALFVEDF